jgi:hypothetical protein
MAAGMAAQAIAFLESADIATTLSRTIRNTSAVLSDASIAGGILHTLLGMGTVRRSCRGSPMWRRFWLFLPDEAYVAADEAKA